MDLGTFQQHAIQELTGIYGREEAASLVKMMVTDILGYRPYEVAMRRTELLDQAQLARLQGVVVRLKAHEPIQYIFGRAWFNGMELRVNEHTLIPRQETEELVAWIVQDGLSKGGKVLDIGTGSGCIAVSLAKAFSHARIDAIDISEGAIKVAAANAFEQEVKVRFVLRDVLRMKTLSDPGATGDTQPYEVIVSNPPYVRDLEKEEIRPNVLEYEPASALFVTNHDPLIFYRKIARMAFENLLEGGRLYFEINQYLGPETAALLEELGFSRVALRKDLLGNNRMIKAVK